MYIYCVVCYRVIIAPYVRSVDNVFAYLLTLDDDSERPMDYETSLLPKLFPTIISHNPLLTLMAIIKHMSIMTPQHHLLCHLINFI